MGDGFTEIAMAAVSEQVPFETMTEYVVLAEGDTTIGFAVDPVVHE